MPQSLLLLNLSGRLVTPIRAALSSTPRTRNKTHISGIANRNSHSDPDPSSDILSIKANHAVNQPKPSLQSESVHVLSASGTGFANSKGTSTSLSNKSTSAKVTISFGATTEFSVQETEGHKETSRTNVHTSAIGENA